MPTFLDAKRIVSNGHTLFTYSAHGFANSKEWDRDSPSATVSDDGKKVSIDRDGTVKLAGDLGTKTKVSLKVTLPIGWLKNVDNFQAPAAHPGLKGMRIKRTPAAFFGVCTASYPLNKPPIKKGAWAFGNTGISLVNGGKLGQHHAQFYSGDIIEVRYTPLTDYAGRMQWWLNNEEQNDIRIRFTKNDWYGENKEDHELALCVGAAGVGKGHAVTWEVSKGNM
jgi:hypothetical protein